MLSWNKNSDGARDSFWIATERTNERGQDSYGPGNIPQNRENLSQKRDGGFGIASRIAD